MKNSKITLRVVIKYFLISLVVVGFLGYTLFQARLLLTGPTLETLDTLNAVQSERTVTLEGRAQNVVKITLNGRDIYTDKNGYFKEVLVLENGYTIATIEGTDRYGRTSTLTRTFVYKPLQDDLEETKKNNNHASEESS